MGMEETTTEREQGANTHAPHVPSYDQATRSRLVEENLPLARRLARLYVGRGLDFEDLYQEGCIGLMHAADTFDDARGTEFSTHATWCIRSALWRALKEKSSIIRIPSYLFYARKIPMISLDAPLFEDDTCLAEMLEDTTAPDPAQYLEQAEMLASLSALIEQLPPREQLILRLRYGIGGGQHQSFADVGRLLGITRQSVYSTELRACRKLHMLLTTGNKPSRKKQARREEQQPNQSKGLSKQASHARITYHLQPAFCSKERCRKCREGQGHGPYWHAYQYINGRLKHTYIGKHAPFEVQQRTTATTEVPS